MPPRQCEVSRHSMPYRFPPRRKMLTAILGTVNRPRLLGLLLRPCFVDTSFAIFKGSRREVDA